MSDATQEIVKTIVLREPIVRIGSDGAEERVEKLEFCRFKARLLRHLTGGSAYDLVMTLAGKLTGQLPGVIDELGADDAAEVFDYVGPFVPGVRPLFTGLSESSPTRSSGLPASSGN